MSTSHARRSTTCWLRATGTAQFLNAWKSAFAVALSPLTWPPAGVHRRRCLLTHFPYALVYRTDAEPIRVVALVHFRRKPAAWKSRR